MTFARSANSLRITLMHSSLILSLFSEAVLSLYRKNASGMAIAALGVLLLITVIWILLELESPLAWMEHMNKENRHRDMMKATGGPSYKPPM